MDSTDWWYTLTEAQQKAARRANIGRDYDSPNHKRLPVPGMTMEETQLNSIAAEIAAASLFCCVWVDDGKPDHEEGDLDGPFPIEVRWVPSDDRRLIVKPRDIPGRIVVLMSGLFPTYKARGWMRVEECQREDWWFTGMKVPNYRVPNDSYLHDNEELLNMVIDQWYS